MAPPPGHLRSPDTPEQATPVCRCRVLYLSSAVPHASKDGLQGIQGPLHELYPSDGVAGANGIDSWLSVWSNGLLLENVDEQRSKVTRFFPIESLHYCAAVRHVLMPGPGGVRNPMVHFMPLDAPFARAPNPLHPPLFAAILRRTSGLKVLECHVFMCRREAPANALVRCCFHVYADAMAARQLDVSLYDSIYGVAGKSQQWDESEARLDVGEKGDETSEGAATPTPPRSTPTKQADPRRAPINGKLPATHPLSVDVGDGDVSIKVPARSPRSQHDASWPIYGTGRSRALRPRQRVMPAAPPPPPQQNGTGGRRRRQLGTDGTDQLRSASAAGFTRPSPSPSPEAGRNGWREWALADNPHRRSYSRAEVYSSYPEDRSSHSPQGRTLPGRRARQASQPLSVSGLSPPPHRSLLAPPAGYSAATMSLSRSRAPRDLRPFVAHRSAGSATPDLQVPSQQYLTLERPRSRRDPRDANHLAVPHHHSAGRRHHMNERAFGFSMQQEQRSRSQGSLIDLVREEKPSSRHAASNGKDTRQLMANLDLNGDANKWSRAAMNGATRHA